MYELLTPDGRVYDRVATAADVVRRQSKGMGSGRDEALITGAVGEQCTVRSARRFSVGTAAGSPVATYRYRRV